MKKKKVSKIKTLLFGGGTGYSGVLRAGLVAAGLCIIILAGARAGWKMWHGSADARPALTAEEQQRHRYWLDEIAEARQAKTLSDAFRAQQGLRHSVPHLTYYTESERHHLNVALDALEAELVASETAGLIKPAQWQAGYEAQLSRVNVQGLLEDDDNYDLRKDYIYLIVVIGFLIWIFW